MKKLHRIYTIKKSPNPTYSTPGVNVTLCPGCELGNTCSTLYFVYISGRKGSEGSTSKKSLLKLIFLSSGNTIENIRKKGPINTGPIMAVLIQNNTDSRDPELLTMKFEKIQKDIAKTVIAKNLFELFRLWVPITKDKTKLIRKQIT